MPIGSVIDDWTIDTVILYECAKNDIDAAYFLLGISQKKKNVVFDRDGYIRGQYEKCIIEIKGNPRVYPRSDLVERWFKHIVDKLAVKNIGFLQDHYRKELLSMRFHDDDLAFIGACHCSNNKRIVSRDSDYSQEIIDYLKAKMNIEFSSVENAMQLLEQAP